ncbi:unnamed protein product [Sphagnum balticum]
MQAHLPIVTVHFHLSRTSVTSPKYRRSPSLETRIPFDVSPGRCTDWLRDQKSIEEERRSRSSNFARSDVFLREKESLDKSLDDQESLEDSCHRKSATAAMEQRFDAQQTADYAPVQESALVIVQVEEESLVEEMKQSGVEAEIESYVIPADVPVVTIVSRCESTVIPVNVPFCYKSFKTGENFEVLSY